MKKTRDFRVKNLVVRGVLVVNESTKGGIGYDRGNRYYEGDDVDERVHDKEFWSSLR